MSDHTNPVALAREALALAWEIRELKAFAYSFGIAEKARIMEDVAKLRIDAASMVKGLALAVIDKDTQIKELEGKYGRT